VSVPTNKGFEKRAAGLLRLRLQHRQFDDALAALREFEGTATPSYRNADVEAEDEQGFRFDDDDDDDTGGDAHVQAVMIIGPPGTGKSGLLDDMESRPEYKSDLGGDDDLRPLIRIDVPDFPSPKEVVREICAKLHSPAPGKWTRGQVARHLRELFREVGLRFLLMDEAHVLVEHLTARQVVINARFLKFLLVSCRAPIILAGEPPLEELLRHKALERRMQAPIRLGPYVWGTFPEVEEWMGLTGGLAEHLGFADSALCTDLDLAMRLYLDAGGIVGLLAKRLIEAGRLAHTDGRNDISKSDFEQAWRRWRGGGSRVAADPLKIAEASAAAAWENPYAAKAELFQELWTAPFHPNAQSEATGRPTRRGSHGPKNANKGFGR